MLGVGEWVALIGLGLTGLGMGVMVVSILLRLERRVTIVDTIVRRELTPNAGSSVYDRIKVNHERIRAIELRLQAAAHDRARQAEGL